MGTDNFIVSSHTKGLQLVISTSGSKSQENFTGLTGFFLLFLSFSLRSVLSEKMGQVFSL